MIEFFFKVRQWLAGLPALIALGFVVLSAQTIKVFEAKPAAPQIMKVSMVSLTEPSKPEEQPLPEPIEPPPPVEPIAPQPVELAPPTEPDEPAPVVEIKKPIPPKQETPKPKEHKPTEPRKPVKHIPHHQPKVEKEAKADTPPSAPPKPAAAEHLAPKPIASEPKPNPSAVAEADYVAKVRADLEASKRYPTGREASLTQPSGTVRIWMLLSRKGKVLESGVEKTSHSMLLDRTAQITVRRSSFAPFPADSWPGADSHRFTVDMNYQPAQ